MKVYIPTKIYNRAVQRKFEIVDEQAVRCFSMKCMLTGKLVFPKTMKTLGMLINGEQSMVVYSDEIDKGNLIKNGMNEEYYTEVIL